MKSNKNYNNDIPLKKTTTIIEKENNKNTFSAFIKEKRMDLDSPSGKNYLSTEDLAAKLDISYEQFRKIINKNKITKKRDCIIAICAVLELDSFDTNEALVNYNYMPILDVDNPRDDFLINILEEQQSNHLTIDEINKCLLRNNFPELDIIDHRNSKKNASGRIDPTFTLLKKQTRIFADESAFDNPYNSLVTEYSLNRYHCVAEMWLDNTKDREVCHLKASTRHNYLLEKLGKNINKFETFKSPEDSGIFKDYYLELKGMANHELKKLYSILNDTKNYQTRVSANIKNDTLYVYSETYNYSIPEIEEYYLLEHHNNELVMSVYHKSEFMRYYLDTDEYTALYGKNTNKLIAQYRSIEEIEHDKGQPTTILKSRSYHFKALIEQTKTLISDIKEQKRYIRDLKYIYDDKDQVCQFFNVDKEFQCTLDNDYSGMMYASIQSVDFNFEDCGKVNITLDDLYKAFELGFKDINQICRIKKKLGAIEKIIR